METKKADPLTPKEVLRKIFNWAMTAVITLLALLIAVAIFSKATGKRVFSYSILWVLTESMEDTIPVNSYILVKEIEDPSEIVEGDIISFYSRDPQLGGALNTHRVYSVVTPGQQFITKGDNKLTNQVPDSYPVNSEDLYGKYVRNLPFMTFLGRLYATKAGLMLTLLLVFAGTSVWFSGYTKRTVKANKQKEIDRLVAAEIARLEAEKKSFDTQYSAGTAQGQDDPPKT